MHDITLTVNGSAIIANTSGATYQWLDCNNTYAAIPGETNQSFTADGGSYAVAITQGACTDTSACISIAAIEDELFAGFSVYSNPVRDELVIEMEGRTEEVNVQMLNTLVAVVFNATFATKTIVPTRNFVPGLYVLRLEIGDVRAYRKIIIE